jgi:endonuclease/exonuclease/phosphatase family metal-dependent hydrolase
MKAVLRMMGWILAMVVGGLVASLLWASAGRYGGGAVERVPVLQWGTSVAPVASSGELGILSWNIAYARGPAGDEAGPWSREHIVEHLDNIAQAIAALNLDVVALQEVDFDSERSHRIDQAAYIARRLGWDHGACVVTWQHNYVPWPYWPPSRHFGRMKSGQCVLSRHPLHSHVRHLLPQPASHPFWYNLFYLNRVIQSMEVEVHGERVPLFNIHLEAFDPVNRMRQARVLADLLGESPPPTQIMLGDFNALPPEAKRRHGFVDEPGIDFRGDTTLDLFWTRSDLREVFQGVEGSPPVTFPAEAPTRRLDHVFVGKGWELGEVGVPDVASLSDHLPVLARLRRVGPAD